MCVSHRVEAEKSKVEVPAGSVHGEGLLPGGRQLAAFLL